jgi:diguanylate cyclase (GGDEF)-like protein
MSYFHQSLVTIPNRYAFFDRIEQSVIQNSNMSLMLIDVVRFSDVSTSFGYKAGDIILLEIANRINALFGSDALLGRISGDIFGLVLAGRHRKRDLAQFYTHLVEHFKTPICFGEHAFIADFNVGAVANLANNKDTNILFSRAEAALKQAKGNKYENLNILSLKEKSATGRSMALKADLKRAINNDELEIYFQPKIDLTTLEIIGAECLLRWNHPLDGLVFPGPLIEAAESYNMMNEVGYWTLEQAFKSALEFNARGLNIQISVNMSPTQLYDLNFVKKLRELSLTYCVSLDQFELELTEDIVVSNSMLVKKQLAEIRELGMSVAVDDFGKGYSNLAYIRDLSIDTIKIDKVFVMELTGKPVNKAIVEATQVIARALGANVVAEGIESLEQLHILRDIGILSGQGFLFSKAVPLEEFVALTQMDLSVGTSLAYANRAG